MTNTATKHLWQAEDYHRNSSVQNVAANQLMQSMQLNGNELILDVGCGDGKITATIANHVPMGHVIGLDISPEMVDFACKSFPKKDYPNLDFSIKNAQDFNYCEELNVVFSSFALQWLPEPSFFFRCAYKSLKPSGYLAATIPLGISAELEEAIDIVISLPMWTSYFESFSPKWHFAPSDKYKQLLIKHQFLAQQFIIGTQMTVFPTRKDFEKYVIQWFTYLQPLPQHLKQHFFTEVIDKYLELKPALWSGEIEFQFFRLDFVATKSTLPF